MRFIKYLLFTSLVLFQSCELLDEQKTENVDQNQSNITDQEKPTELVEEKKPKPTLTKSTPPKPPKSEIVKEKPKPRLKSNEPTQPIKASFTPELLSAVKNWNAIPKSVFPLRAVTIKKDVKFNIYSQFGQPIGSSMLPAGREVVAIGHKGNLLAVSPSNKGSMRGSISMDDTDFKEGVAYLFELRKRQRVAYAEMKAREAANVASVGPKKLSNPSTQAKKVSQSSGSSLFEDLPSPGDFGHGKFCICSDCRTKRLAQTGSMK